MNTWTRRIIVPALLATSCLATFGCTATLAGDQSGDQDADGNGDGAGKDGAGKGGSGQNGDPATKDPSVCVPGVPATSQLPRLTREQYDNTIRDLFGIDSQPSSMLEPDSIGSLGPQAWNGYKTAAAAVAAQVMTSAGARDRAIPCAPAGDSSACAAELIETLGRRAFRRPLDDEEKARFQALYTNRAELTPSGTFEEAAELIVEAFLLSPSFLMRAEIAETPEGEYFALSNHEVASRLSYLLWSSTPDDQLLDAADAGALSTPEQILEQARRMLADPRSHEMVKSFHAKYLHMGPGTRWAYIQRDRTLFPNFDEGVAPLLTEETQRFIHHIIFERGGTFQDLVTTPLGFVNASLAPFYGLNPARFTGSELQPVELDAATRSGLFTRLGFLASQSSPDRTSPILRGAFLQKYVFCTDIPAPPMMAEGTPLPTDDSLTTNRARVDAQTAPSNCSSCHHGYINPAGFALETYDAVGAYQETESFSGAPIDTAVELLIGSRAETVPIDGPIELSSFIAQAPEAQRCYAQHWVKFAYQRDINSEDTCTVDDLSSKLTAGGYSVLNLMADLTQSPSFRYRAVQTEVAP